MGTEADITPGVQLPELTIVEPPMPDDGPVLIRVWRLIGISPAEAEMASTPPPHVGGSADEGSGSAPSR